MIFMVPSNMSGHDSRTSIAAPKEAAGYASALFIAEDTHELLEPRVCHRPERSLHPGIIFSESDYALSRFPVPQHGTVKSDSHESCDSPKTGLRVVQQIFV